MKNLHLGGARDLWRSLAPTTDCCPMKKVLYADEVEKILSEVHFQHMASARPWELGQLGFSSDVPDMQIL